MSENIRCSAKTSQGIPCRNFALTGSNPPACRWHRANMNLAEKVTIQFYASTISEEEIASLTHEIEAESLSAELALVRVVIRRLMDRLDDPNYTLLPDDLRKLAGLIFSGTRTVAHLLSRQTEQNDDNDEWLHNALDELSADFNLDI